MPEAGSGVEEYKVISQAQYFLFLSWTFESSVNFLKSQNFSDWPYLERKIVSKFNMIWRKVASAMLGPFPFPQTPTRTVPGNQAGIASLRRPSWSRLLLATGHQPGLPHTIFTKSLLFQFLFSLLFSILFTIHIIIIIQFSNFIILPIYAYFSEWSHVELFPGIWR